MAVPGSSTSLTLSWPRPLSYRNQSINLLRNSMDWLLYDNGLRHERVKHVPIAILSKQGLCVQILEKKVNNNRM